jgi:GDPmannose 4,6-dehydratase
MPKIMLKGMWRMLQQDKPDDFVLATGETHPVREFVDKAFKEAGIEIRWEGTGVDEKGYNKATNEIIVEVDEKYFRPTEVELLLGDPTKAKKELGWKPTYTFDALVKEMMQADMKLFERDKYLHEGGHKVFNYHE